MKYGEQDRETIDTREGPGRRKRKRASSWMYFMVHFRFGLIIGKRDHMSNG